MIVESIVTNMWWIIIIGIAVTWTLGAVDGWVLCKLMSRGGK